MNTFEKIMPWGLGEHNESLLYIGKVFVVQFAKATPTGIVTFLVSLAFCPPSISAMAGVIIIIALAEGGLSVLD